MPTDRLFKFSVSGLMFLMISMFFYIFFGGSICVLENLFNNTVLSLIAVFFSTPVIGLIISTSTYGILYLFYGYDIIYYVPKEKEVVKRILAKSTLLVCDQNIEDEILRKGELRWNRKLKERFYPYYQAKVKDYISEPEKFGFLDRRWSTYWTNINSISAIILSFLLNLIIIMADAIDRTFEWSYLKAFGLLIICSYVFFAYRNLKRARKEAEKVETLFLINPKKFK